MKPTDNQIKEFWERFGFKKGETYFDDDSLPQITLDNLFRYAVPKLGQVLYLDVFLHDWIDKFYIEELDPTISLFWAIWEVIK